MGIAAIKNYEFPESWTQRRPSVPWMVDTNRVALLIHDMQNYFLRPYESAGVVTTLIQNIAMIRRKCHQLNIPVVYSAQKGDQLPEQRGLLTDFWGPGLSNHGDDCAIVKGLEPLRDRDLMIDKFRYSAFQKNNFRMILDDRGRDQIIICGVYAHIGCMATAVDAFMADIQPFVVADAVADFSLDHHLMALDHIAQCSGKIVSTNELLDRLGGVA